MSNKNLRLNYLNSNKSDVRICLTKGDWLHTTYKSNLRLGDEEGREILCIPQGSDNCVIEADLSREVQLQLTHGRSDPAVDMEDWGTSYEGPALTAEMVHIKADGYHLVRADGVTMIPYVDDMLHHDGVYYGDVSVVVV